MTLILYVYPKLLLYYQIHTIQQTIKPLEYLPSKELVTWPISSIFPLWIWYWPLDNQSQRGKFRIPDSDWLVQGKFTLGVSPYKFHGGIFKLICQVRSLVLCKDFSLLWYLQITAFQAKTSSWFLQATVR